MRSSYPRRVWDWIAPRGLYWICRNKAYIYLSGNWEGSCIIGIIKSSFSLLPLKTGELLGYPVPQPLQRVKKEFQIGDWKDDVWLPEQIIQYYRPATWAEDGSWGYHFPIYMLKQIIWLQAVLEVITNKTRRALTLLAHYKLRWEMPSTKTG